MWKNVSKNMLRDLKTQAYVLRRTNYAEADRILNLITPEGKFSAMARGVRKARSKLAGGVEMFTLSEVNLHFGKGDLATLTSAKMVRFYTEILKDLERTLKASEFLKEINRAAEGVETPEIFEVLDKSLMALNMKMNLDLVEAWFLLNLARAMGEQINLFTDISGTRLDIESRYNWNIEEMGLELNNNGVMDADAIKVLRLMWTMDILVINRIKNVNSYVPEILRIARAVKKVVK